MYEIEIKFRVNNIKDIKRVLTQIKTEIKQGEFNGLNNPNGFLMNKFNTIHTEKTKDKDGYHHGDFRILTKEYMDMCDIKSKV
jgi:hypothetical protein